VNAVCSEQSNKGQGFQI